VGVSIHRGVIIMKRSLFLAVSVLALAAVSKPLFAAEAETPAPSERAAPTTERTERARPARERRAAPARTTSGQQASQTSSYTGVQAGGFGGGNAGGGGFADPVCLGNNGQLRGLNFGCTGAPFNQSLTKSGGIGGGNIQWTVPVTPWIVVGVVGDVTAGQTSASSSQSNFYMTNPLIPTQVTTEQIQNSVSQSTSGSARLKVGFVVPLQYTSFMPYFTVGWVHSTLQGSFSYNASNYNSLSCTAFNPLCATNAASAVNWSRSSNGVVFGFGAEMPIPAFGPGVVLVADYTRAQFGSFDVNFPVAIATSCVQSSVQNCAGVDTAHFSNVVSNRFTVGARLKLF